MLVHAAAAFDRSDLAGLDLAVWRRVQAVNVESALLLAQAFVPGMAARAFGRIIFAVSDTVWASPAADLLPYVTSKGALPETYGAEGAPGAIVFILEIDRDGYVISAAVFTLPYARREHASHEARRTNARDCIRRQPPGTELRIQRRTINYRFQPGPDQVLIRQNDLVFPL